MILLIDNYDSFSYNLYQLVGSITGDVEVVRNDGITVEGIRKLSPYAIILSPGPGRPADAGICEDVIKELGKEFPILGVCLGHQAICEANGATVTYARHLMHGKQSIATVDTEDPLFEGLGEKVPVARYHSLAVDPNTLPENLKVIATADDGDVMGVRSTEGCVYGLQFHPESIMTPDGRAVLENFIKSAKKARQ